MKPKYELILNDANTGMEYRRPDGTHVCSVTDELNALYAHKRRIKFVEAMGADVCYTTPADAEETDVPVGWSCGYYTGGGGEPEVRTTEGHASWDAAVDAAIAGHEAEGRVS